MTQAGSPDNEWVVWQPLLATHIPYLSYGGGQVRTYRGRRVVSIRYLEGNQEFTVQERLEQEAYLADPSAFWNRPDGDYLSEEPYRPVVRVYDVVPDRTVEMVLAGEDEEALDKHP